MILNCMLKKPKKLIVVQCKIWSIKNGYEKPCDDGNNEKVHETSKAIIKSYIERLPTLTPEQYQILTAMD